jgi:hypothetical protein
VPGGGSKFSGSKRYRKNRPGASQNLRFHLGGPMNTIIKFCIRNSEDRCIQCRDYAPRKRVCPVYRATQKQRRAAVEAVK